MPPKVSGRSQRIPKTARSSQSPEISRSVLTLQRLPQTLRGFQKLPGPPEAYRGFQDLQRPPKAPRSFQRCPEASRGRPPEAGQVQLRTVSLWVAKYHKIRGKGAWMQSRDVCGPGQAQLRTVSLWEAKILQNTRERSQFDTPVNVVVAIQM